MESCHRLLPVPTDDRANDEQRVAEDSVSVGTPKTERGAVEPSLHACHERTQVRSSPHVRGLRPPVAVDPTLSSHRPSEKQPYHAENVDPSVVRRQPLQ